MANTYNAGPGVNESLVRKITNFTGLPEKTTGQLWPRGDKQPNH